MSAPAALLLVLLVLIVVVVVTEIAHRPRKNVRFADRGPWINEPSKRVMR